MPHGTPFYMYRCTQLKIKEKEWPGGFWDFCKFLEFPEALVLYISVHSGKEIALPVRGNEKKQKKLMFEQEINQITQTDHDY